ncbi:hypothetical protein PRZ48_001947 [Zasmidium cellare]|uniref:histidine kinase n=1 Tax=Zasmidium cellare TaxID=395010 RepID=A0ABR0F2M9_ZASCE|nr:hypothetical protein PRZ48_001947 [Zasmidium cellare]
MLFFFDVTHAFVLAEATRTLSLAGEEVHQIGDPLWLGFTAIPRGFSVCEQTISIVAPPLSTACLSKPVNVISDLSEDTRFCGRPYVQSSPNVRFYAGVPITSPEGINIGAFCALDDVQREGLDDVEKEFMRDMSSTIMTHLTLVRAKAEQKRETRMVTALGRFVQDSSGLREPKRTDEDPDEFQDGHTGSVRLVDTELSAEPESYLEQAPRRLSKELYPTLNLPDRVETLSSPSPPASVQSHQDEIPQSEEFDSGTKYYDDDPAARSMVEDLRNEVIPTNIQRTFERAAREVRDAIGVDGVVFLDASIGTFGGLRDARNSVPRGESNGTTLNGYSFADDPVLWANRGTSTPNTCYVLGSSLSYDMPFDITETNITEPLLESLLAKYPSGKIWTFEGQGFESEDMTDSANEGSASSSRRQPSTPGAARDRWERRAHAEEIQRLFPRVRSFGFVGMWDHVRERWFAGGIFWTSSPFRVLSVESELLYISAFCDVIMTETKHLEAERSDKAKMDFLSSISHELRSPLHGILGSTECLQEQEQSMDIATELLVSQIESCGRTLLGEYRRVESPLSAYISTDNLPKDIIDHLLEYSRINFSTTPAPKPEIKGTETSSLEDKQFQHLAPVASTNGHVALDTITEEVIDAAVFSFLSGRDATHRDHVSVMIDIDSPGSSKWKCQMVTGGWKRICMNIVTNALKYTQRGYIHVGLQTTLIPNSGDQLAAVFTVSDSGKGMTKEFLKNHLFRAFSQEDSLSSGIGLGMNLVAKIVQTFGGKIDVQSEQGVGTRVTVYVPLQQAHLSQGVVLPRNKSKLHIRRKAVCVVDRLNIHGCQSSELVSTGDATAARAHALMVATIEKSCGQLGLKVCRNGTSTSDHAQLSIMLQSDLTALLQDPEKSDVKTSLGRKPLVVICESSHAERRLRKSKVSLVARQVVEYLAQPCGPNKLEKAIASCLTRQANVMTTNPIQNDTNKDILSTPDTSSKDVPLPPVITTLPSRPATPSLEVSSSNDGLVLLLVDDNPVNLQLLKTYASKRGFPRHLASNGLEAVEVYKETHLLTEPSSSHPGVPNVVLMDINMPICDGYEATKRIRAYEHEYGLTPATIIALTGLGSADAQREAYACGFDLFLTKPVQLKKLTALLEGLKKDRQGSRA